MNYTIDVLYCLWCITLGIIQVLYPYVITIIAWEIGKWAVKKFMRWLEQE